MPSTAMRLLCWTSSRIPASSSIRFFCMAPPGAAKIPERGVRASARMPACSMEPGRASASGVTRHPFGRAFDGVPADVPAIPDGLALVLVARAAHGEPASGLREIALDLLAGLV